MSDHYDGVLLEDIDSKLDQIIEVLATKASNIDLRIVSDGLTKVEDNISLLMRIVKEEAAITRKHASTLTDHEIRITDLEDEDNLDYA